MHGVFTLSLEYTLYRKKKKKKKKKKTSQPMKKLEIKITNLRFASLFVEI
jgi:hypothetical protein